MTLSGEGIGSVRVDTITATAFLKDGKIYDQRSITVNRSLGGRELLMRKEATSADAEIL